VHDPRAELGRFLATRRARLSPSDVGLENGRRRRVAGLRREEVAVLAHISETWYARLEQGQDVNASAEVLESIARALRLDEHERSYVFALAGQAASGQPASAIEPRLSAAFVQAVDALTYAPAVVCTARFDVVACNAAYRVLFGDIEATPVAKGNIVRQLFLDPARRQFFPQWESVALGVIKSLRLNAARLIGDPDFAAFVAGLREESELFAQWWDRYDVVHVVDGEKEIDHPHAGRMALDHAVLALDDGTDLRLIVYTVRPGSESERKLRDLVDGRLVMQD